MSEKSEKAEAVKHAVGASVTFKSGRAGTEYTAEVVRHDGQFLVTKDSTGKERKVRHGAAKAA